MARSIPLADPTGRRDLENIRNTLVRLRNVQNQRPLTVAETQELLHVTELALTYGFDVFSRADALEAVVADLRLQMANMVKTTNQIKSVLEYGLQFNTSHLSHDHNRGVILDLSQNEEKDENSERVSVETLDLSLSESEPQDSARPSRAMTPISDTTRYSSSSVPYVPTSPTYSLATVDLLERSCSLVVSYFFTLFLMKTNVFYLFQTSQSPVSAFLKSPEWSSAQSSQLPS